MLIWGFGLLAAALLLVIVDVFVPTFGVLAFLSLALSIAGVVCLFKVSSTWGTLGTVMVIIGGPVVFFFGLRIMPTTPLGRRLVLGSHDQSSDSSGEGSSGAAADPAARQADGSSLSSRGKMQALVGQQGEVVSDLRPIGMVRIGTQRYDALSETTLVRAGAMVRVMSVEASTLRVRPVDS